MEERGKGREWELKRRGRRRTCNEWQGKVEMRKGVRKKEGEEPALPIKKIVPLATYSEQ